MSQRSPLGAVWRFVVGKPLTSSWWVTLGVALGFMIGVFFTMLFAYVATTQYHVRFLRFLETRFPKPVTTPPAGMVWVEVLTTAYCPCTICCGANASGRTSTGRDVHEFPYGIASAKEMVAYHTPLFIPGYGFGDVDDTGGAMRQDAKQGILHLDLRFKDHQTAREWGRRWIWIAVPDAPAIPETKKERAEIP